MLKDSFAFSGFSVTDLTAAKAFYNEILGLELEETPGMGFRLTFLSRASVFVYEKPDHVPAGFTILNFPVADIDTAVEDLVASGVTFEKYVGMHQDEKGIMRGRAVNQGPDIAWFKDPAGNILSVLQN